MPVPAICTAAFAAATRADSYRAGSGLPGTSGDDRAGSVLPGTSGDDDKALGDKALGDLPARDILGGDGDCARSLSSIS